MSDARWFFIVTNATKVLKYLGKIFLVAKSSHRMVFTTMTNIQFEEINDLVTLMMVYNDWLWCAVWMSTHVLCRLTEEMNKLVLVLLKTFLVSKVGLLDIAYKNTDICSFPYLVKAGLIIFIFYEHRWHIIMRL